MAINNETEFDEFAPWLVVIITLVGGALRVLLLDQKGMGLDETVSVWLANQNIGGLLQWLVRIDQHPPLYYTLLHFWIPLNGDSPYHVRLLSVLFGAGAIPIIYLIGKRLAGSVVGLAAAVFLAVSPFHIYFAQEARMYTLLTFNAAATIYALVRLLTDPRSANPLGHQFGEYRQAWRSAKPDDPGRTVVSKDEDFSYYSPRPGPRVFRHSWPTIQIIETDLAWVAYVVFMVATLLTHNTAILLLMAANFFVLGLIFFQRAKKSGIETAFHAPALGNWAKAQVGVLLLWLPWIPSFLQQATAVFQRFWIPAPTFSSVIQVLKSFLVFSQSFQGGIAMGFWILYALVFCLGLVAFRRKFSHFLFLAVLFAVPFLGELVVSIWRPIFLDRTLIWTTIPLFLVLAAGVAQFRFRFVILLVLGGLATINFLVTSDYYRTFRKEDWLSAAGDVAGFAEPDDLILFNSNISEIPFNYYFISAETFRFLQVEKRGIPFDLFDSGIPEPEMTTRDIPQLLAVIGGHKRVWLVSSHNLYTDPDGLIPQTLAAHKKLIRDEDFIGGQVQLYADP